MREAGLTVYDCSCPDKNPFRYLASFFKFLNYQNKSDIVFVGFLGQFLVPFVKICTRKKIIFDAFISIYQTLIFDRKTANPLGITGHLARWIDRYSCHLADKVFLDTDQHIEYFVNTLRLDRNKFHKLLVGSDESVFYPRTSPAKKEFLVHFHGEFQALHGSEYIIESARQLPDVKFQLIGRGKHLERCKKLAGQYDLSNVEFINPTIYEKLPEYMAKADICLGIFGHTAKAQMVIPHKIYEALAMKKPIITADTPAAKELLTDKINIIFIPLGNSQKLTEAIELLKNNRPLSEKIAEGGYKIFTEQCTPRILGREISQICTALLN